MGNCIAHDQWSPDFEEDEVANQIFKLRVESRRIGYRDRIYGWLLESPGAKPRWAYGKDINTSSSPNWTTWVEEDVLDRTVSLLRDSMIDIMKEKIWSYRIMEHTDTRYLYVCKADFHNRPLQELLFTWSKSDHNWIPSLARQGHFSHFSCLSLLCDGFFYTPTTVKSHRDGYPTNIDSKGNFVVLKVSLDWNRLETIAIPAPRLKSTKSVSQARTIGYFGTVLLVSYTFNLAKSELACGFAFVDVGNRKCEPVCYKGTALIGLGISTVVNASQVVINAGNCRMPRTYFLVDLRTKQAVFIGEPTLGQMDSVFWIGEGEKIYAAITNANSGVINRLYCYTRMQLTP